MTTRYSLDGVPVAAVPPDLALYPYGAFTTFVAVDGTVLGWRRHLARLARGAEELWGHRLDHDRVRDAVRAHLADAASGDGTGPVTVRVTAYPADLRLAAPEEARGCRLLVSSSPATFPFEPVEGLTARTAQHTRALAHLKSTDLLTQIRLRRDARLAGYDDALLVDGDRVLEGTTWSVLAWRGGTVGTPDADVLDSITVAHLAEVAAGLGHAVERRTVTLADLAAAELVLAVNVNAPARALARVDDVDLRVDRPLLEAVASAYSALPREPV
ncbi:aminotransferase class IV [Nocardioides sp. YIM 152588]|uniref:aminotransferase class IV n=1 Tax=Nocardioides sp. YIM 152588 TaxID=3158259 RepID=UPI0032E37907